MANEMEHLKINGMEFTVNDPDATHDITKIVSGDTDEWVNLRDLASGTYILSGKFHAYAGHTSTLSFSSALMVNVIRSSSKSSVQIFYPTNNCVQFLEITDEAMTRTNVYLNKVLEYIGTLSDLTTADKTSLVAAINEVASAVADIHDPYEMFDKADIVGGSAGISYTTIDGVEYLRYHAGSSNGFTWTNPRQRAGAVTVTARGVNQYNQTMTGGFSALILKYSDGTDARLQLVNGETVSITTDASKTLTSITGNYDLENWVLLDMSVMSIKASWYTPEPVLVTSPNGTLWSLSVSDDGTVSATQTE